MILRVLSLKTPQKLQFFQEGSEFFPSTLSNDLFQESASKFLSDGRRAGRVAGVGRARGRDIHPGAGVAIHAAAAAKGSTSYDDLGGLF